VGALFPGSGFDSGFVGSDPPLKERKGFAAGKLVGTNDGGLAAPPCACAPPLGAPNRAMEFPVVPVVDCPRFVGWVPSLALKPEEAGVIPLAGAPADLPSLVPNTDGWASTAVVLEADALLNGFVTGCTVGADEFFDMPKLNMGLGGESDGVGAAGGLG
jgi:hypothetical protein